MFLIAALSNAIQIFYAACGILNVIKCTANNCIICAYTILIYTFRVWTEIVGDGAISRLSITQANVQHSGIYTCSVSDTVSQSLRLHIIDGKFGHLGGSVVSQRIRTCEACFYTRINCFDF